MPAKQKSRLFVFASRETYAIKVMHVWVMRQRY